MTHKVRPFTRRQRHRIKQREERERQSLLAAKERAAKRFDRGLRTVEEALDGCRDW